MYILTLEEYSRKRFIALVVPSSVDEYRELLAKELCERMFPYSTIVITRNKLEEGYEFESAIILSRPDSYFDLSQIGVMDFFFKSGFRCYEVFLVGRGEIELVLPQYLTKRIHRKQL